MSSHGFVFSEGFVDGEMVKWFMEATLTLFLKKEMNPRKSPGRTSKYDEEKGIKFLKSEVESKAERLLNFSKTVMRSSS